MHNERQGSKVWVDQSFQIWTPTLTLNFLFTLHLKKKNIIYKLWCHLIIVHRLTQGHLIYLDTQLTKKGGRSLISSRDGGTEIKQVASLRAFVELSDA